jgi:hemoglobin
MRHAEFHINLAAHDAWLKAMRTAVDGVEMKPELKAQLWSYLEMAAAAMVNQLRDRISHQ